MILHTIRRVDISQGFFVVGEVKVGEDGDEDEYFSSQFGDLHVIVKNGDEDG